MRRQVFPSFCLQTFGVLAVKIKPDVALLSVSGFSVSRFTGVPVIFEGNRSEILTEDAA